MQCIVYNSAEMRKKWVLLCIIMILVMVQSSIIAMFSAQPAAQSKLISENIVDRLDWIPEVVPRESVEPGTVTLTYIVRKCAHFYNFFLIGVLLCMSRKICGGGLMQDILWPVLGLIIASADEIHQHFVPGRSGMIEDVMLDFSGVLFGVCFLEIFLGLIFKKRCRK